MLTYISEVAHSSFPAACLSPSHLRKCEGEKGAPSWILLCWQRRGFRSSLGFLRQGEESSVIPRREASDHLHFCLLGCFLAVLVCWDCVQTERGAADCRLQPFRLSTSLALLRHSQTAAATRVTPEERGLTQKGANGVCRRALALVLIMHSLGKAGRRVQFHPDGFPFAKWISCAFWSPLYFAFCQPRAVQS